MKRLVVLGIIVMMITAASAAQAAFVGVALNVQAVGGSGSFHDVQMGWLLDDNFGAPTTNGSDASVDLADSQAPLDDQVQLDIVNSTIATAKVVKDFRSPNGADLGPFQIWRLAAKVPSNTAPDQGATPITVNAWFNPGMATTSALFYILEGNKSTQALCEAALGTSSQLLAIPAGAAGTLSFASSIAAPVLNEDEGTWSVPLHTFTVYAKGLPEVAIPEPGSMLAMFSGLVGLVGFGIRRRR